MDPSSLAHHLLIAMPQLDDPGFGQTVTYIIEHDDQGAMGLTLNRPLEHINLSRVLDSMKIPPRVPVPDDAHPVVAGGPVNTQTGFILHPPCEQMWHSTVVLQSGLWLTTSKDVLEAIACGQGPSHSLIALGYAGWEPGQLEQELVDNAWLTTPALPEMVFDVPFAERWHAAARLMGIDLDLISTQAGHS
jgi:putative transcriptional regulator